MSVLSHVKDHTFVDSVTLRSGLCSCGLQLYNHASYCVVLKRKTEAGEGKDVSVNTRTNAITVRIVSVADDIFTLNLLIETGINLI